MSSAPPASPPRQDINPDLGLMFGVSDLLVPLFQGNGIDRPLAQRMAISAIEAYEPETRADFVNAARIIAFSMAALALLGSAAATADLTLNQKLRALGRANALNRSAEQSERGMMLRRRYQQANPPTPQPAPQPGTKAQPEPGPGDAHLQAAVADAVNEYLAQRPPEQSPPEQGSPLAAKSGAPPASQPAASGPVAIPRQPGAFQAMAGQVTPSPAPTASATASHRTALFRQTALGRVLPDADPNRPVTAPTVTTPAVAAPTVTTPVPPRTGVRGP